jgi:integrase
VLRAQRERALACGHHGPEDFVFATRLGTPTTQRNATRTILRAAKKSELKNVGYHALRHPFASVLIIDLRLDVVQVSRQLGHARPSITLDRYSHLFDRARHADNLGERLGSSGLAAAWQAREPLRR